MYPKPAYVTLLTITCAAVAHQAYCETIKPLNTLIPVPFANNTSFVDNILKRYRRESPESSGGGAGGGGSGGFPEVKPEWKMEWPNPRAMDDLKNAVILTLLDQVAREFEPALPQLVNSYIERIAPSGGESAGGYGVEEDNENYSEGGEPMQGYPAVDVGEYFDSPNYAVGQQVMSNPPLEPPQAQQQVQPAPAPIDDGNDWAEGSSAPTAAVGTKLCRMTTLVLVVRASFVISGRV